MLFKQFWHFSEMKEESWLVIRWASFQSANLQKNALMIYTLQKC